MGSTSDGEVAGDGCVYTKGLVTVWWVSSNPRASWSDGGASRLRPASVMISAPEASRLWIEPAKLVARKFSMGSV